ncbi:MAG TPA: hypothetical protein VNF51_03070 [Candidatus Paceibacterota bacterium]|nr:hypothetical protein [Candidatus Paceibacterota bacterium]
MSGFDSIINTHIANMDFLKTPLLTNHRIIISGAHVEEYKYQKPYGYQLLSDQIKPKGRGPERKQTPEQEKENQKRSGQRAKSNLRRLINANVGEWSDASEQKFSPKFITFTFAENMQDLKEANHLYSDFIKRFNYALSPEGQHHLKYTVVHEIQKRGAVHYHAVFYNLPFVENDRIAELWTHGFTKTKKIKEGTNIGAYIAKYLTKDESTARSPGQKRYFSSKLLKRSLVEREQNHADAMGVVLEGEEPVFKDIFEKDGNIREYRVYDLSKRADIRASVLECAQSNRL